MRSLESPRLGGVPIADLLLALGLLLSTASQLRPAGAAVGPGEICLVVWVVVMLAREAGRLGPPLTPGLSQLLIFWLLFALALSLGTVTGYAIGDIHDPDLFLHDVMAYPLLAAVSLLSVVEPGAALRLHRVTWLLVVLGAAFLALQLASGSGLFDVAPIDPWYWDRFRGWSANPNQLALLCAVLGLVALHLAETAARIGERIAAIATAILAIYVGRLSKSDTFSLVLVAAGPIFFALKLRTWMLTHEAKLTFRSAFARIVVLALPLLLISVVPLDSLIAVQAADFAKGMSKENGKETEQEADLRFHAWREAVSRGLEAGMLGLGPGPHLEIPPSLVSARKTEIQPKYVENPANNGTPNFEAHNTLLDLFTQGGLIAVFSFIWLTAAALFGTYRARSAGLTTLLCGLSIFGFPNLIVRHPSFWFAIALCLVSGDGTGRTPAAAKWS